MQNTNKKNNQKNQDKQNREGAGVFLIFRDNQDKLYVNLFQSKKKEIWSGAGGNFDKHQDFGYEYCAARESREESSNLFSFDVEKLKKYSYTLQVRNYHIFCVFIDVSDYKETFINVFQQVYSKNKEVINNYQNVPSCWNGKKAMEFIEYDSLLQQQQQQETGQKSQFIIRNRTVSVLEEVSKFYTQNETKIQWQKVKLYKEPSDASLYNENCLFLKDLEYFDFE